MSKGVTSLTIGEVKIGAKEASMLRRAAKAMRGTPSEESPMPSKAEIIKDQIRADITELIGALLEEKYADAWTDLQKQWVAFAQDEANKGKAFAFPMGFKATVTASEGGFIASVDMSWSIKRKATADGQVRDGQAGLPGFDQ